MHLTAAPVIGLDLPGPADLACTSQQQKQNSPSETLHELADLLVLSHNPSEIDVIHTHFIASIVATSVDPRFAAPEVHRT